MRTRALLGLFCLLGTSASVWAVAADERPVESEKKATSRLDTGVAESSDEDLTIDSPSVPDDLIPVLLDPNMEVRHVIVGPDGVARPGPGEAEGAVAGPGEVLIYQNTLGINATNFPNNQPISDDIATIAPDGCTLTRYRFKVLGKVAPSGTGGEFTAHYSLYTTCTNAAGTSNAARDLVRIAGTEGSQTFQDDSVIHLVEHILPIPVAIPHNVYFGIRFTRSNCGTVVGAPPLVGFSGDVFDTPGFPCNAFLGGFPLLPHASFWLEMFGTTNCAPSYTAYKAEKPSGSPILLGTDKQGADDLELSVNNCQVIGYEVVVKGVGNYNFDLRRACDGQIIAGTERQFNVPVGTTPLLQVARFTISPPIQLTTDRIFLGFKSNNATAGPINSGINPIIGATGIDYFALGLEGCDTIIPPSGVQGAVNVAITCAGTLPLGACCDPHLTECNAGADLGKRCNNNAACTPPGTCEAVCRQTTEINCPFPPRGLELRPEWQPGEACVPDPFGNDPCGVAACCHVRINPSTLLEEEVCVNLTKNQCDAVPPLEKPRLWQLGLYCGISGQRCPRNACLARDGSCYVAHPTPGCSDPFCCTDVCTGHGESGAFCCSVQWDNACVSFANVDCTRAPGNDQCAPDFPVRGLEGALVIPYPGSIAGNNERASTSASEPGFCCNEGVGQCLNEPFVGVRCVVDQDCGGGGDCTDRFPDPGSTALNQIWFKFTVPPGTSTTNFVGLNTCSSNSPALDSVMQVFRAQNHASELDACRSLVPLACNDDALNCSSTNRNSRVCLRDLTPGETYFVMVGAKTPNRLGEYRVSLSTSCSGGITPPNDYCHKGTLLNDPTPGDPLVVPFTTSRACIGGANKGMPCTGVSSECPGSSCSNTPASFDCPEETCVPNAQNDIWFDYIATCSGQATISTCGGNNDDTNLVVYESQGPTCTTCPPLVSPIANGCSGDVQTGGCGLASRVTVNVEAGNCYKIRIADNSGFPASGNLTITCAGAAADCQPNGVPDNQDIANCPVGDPDCQDCNDNNIPDFCDIRDGENDCQPDGIPDGCQLEGNDSNGNNIPDECEGVCTGIIGSNPTNCSIDARRPFNPSNPGSPEGFDSIQLTFDSGCDVAGIAAGDFTVACTPAGPPCPTISNASAVGQVVTVTLNAKIPTSKWTCISHTASGTMSCLGNLPGDSSADRTSSPPDILKLIDNINGTVVPPLPIHQCDIDRGATCAPPDIVVLIDLLNGANGYGIWNGKSLPVCPTCGDGTCGPGESNANCAADCPTP